MVHVENAALRGAKWFHKGYCGQGNVEHLLDSCLGRTAVIVGSAQGVFEEYEQHRHGALVFAVNDIGMYLPQVDHWVAMHTPKLDHWVALRRDITAKPCGNLDFRVHDGGLYGERDWYQWRALTPTMSYSGMFAAQIAYLMGCEPIVLCGIPQDSTARFFEREARKDGAYANGQQQIKEECAFKPEFKKAIRSCSGWTRDYFGSP